MVGDELHVPRASARATRTHARVRVEGQRDMPHKTVFDVVLLDQRLKYGDRTEYVVLGQPAGHGAIRPRHTRTEAEFPRPVHVRRVRTNMGVIRESRDSTETMSSAMNLRFTTRARPSRRIAGSPLNASAGRQPHRRAWQRRTSHHAPRDSYCACRAKRWPRRAPSAIQPNAPLRPTDEFCAGRSAQPSGEPYRT